MKFRRMADEISDDQVVLILRIVFPYARLKSYERNIGHNFITVHYLLPDDEITVDRRIDFLPDDIYIIGESENEPPDGVPLEKTDVLYRYMQFSIANGFSEYLLDNPYMK